MSTVRCSGCGSENPPEFPLEEWPFCMNCGAQLGALRFNPYPQEPPPPDPYQRQNPYPPDPYAPAQPGYPPAQQGYPPEQPGYPPQQQYPPADYDPRRADTPHLAAPSGSARLILESGLGKVEYPLDGPVKTIGRSRSNDIPLEDSRVSRHHARVVRDGNGFFVEDLNSRNGTRVDDRAVRDNAPLTDGSIIKIGDSTFRFVTSAPVGPPPRPAPMPSPFGQDQGWSQQPPPARDAPVPEVFVTQWSPAQCPSCQGLKTMRPIVYGRDAQTPGAQEAARMGQVALGDGPARPNGPNAECRACGTRVRIVHTGG
jgi:pSer/pThr/pTyr-binding forkhead associated (FHA) protein